MGKGFKIGVIIFGIMSTIVLVVWYSQGFLDIPDRHPKPIWFALGVMATIAVEGLICIAISFARRIRRD